MTMATPAGAPAGIPATDGWNRYNSTVLTICILGWAFDVY